jgi:hypothetical protein
MKTWNAWLSINYTNGTKSLNFDTTDYQLFANGQKMKRLIISMFHSVPGVPRVKMERLQYRSYDANSSARPC